MQSGKFLLILLIIISALSLKSQTLKSFTGDPVKFPEEAQALFSTVSNRTIEAKIEELLNPFLGSWNAGLYNETEKTVIIENANLLLTKKAVIYPDLFIYFSIIHNLKKRGNKEAVLDWSEDFSKHLPELIQRKIEPYLEQYDLIFDKSVLFQSNTFSWFISDTSLNLEYDTAISLVYKKAILTCASKKDTFSIFNTNGIFYPQTQKWEGHDGRVTWERVGFSPDSVFADLSYYHVAMKFSEYHADTVKLVNKKYFKQLLYGDLTDKIMLNAPGPLSTYPKFESYLKNYEIPNLYRNINYVGGLSVEGARIIGSGEIDKNATLIIFKDGKAQAYIRSLAFRIQGDQITANPASLCIITGEDSIYHPGLQLKYNNNDRELLMFRPESAISQSPFFDGYHKVDMECGAIYWNIESDTVNFDSEPRFKRDSTSEFKSNNYFSKYEFDKIQGMDDRNPLYIIKDYSKSYGTDEVTPAALALYMHKPEDQVKAMLLKLSIQGFLYYDLINDKAILRDRLNRFIDARAGKIDYDLIKIHSTTLKNSNATLYLKNLDLLVRGVDSLFLSGAQQVSIYPDKSGIILKKGLDIVFSGRVKAGLFEFFSHNCSFEYDSFRLNLPLIDSLGFKVKSFEKNIYNERPLIRVNSVIENLSGQIQIDNPSNKSGLKLYPEYPIFDSKQESFVYYDKNRHYDRKRFAYHVAPFKLDSLDNFSTDNLQFDGYLVSSGIFPDIKQPLKVQPDYSLGFINRTPEEGYSAYSGNGKYFDEVNLSNKGLRGKGQLKYLTSNTDSKDFLFYPDSMMTKLAEHFTIDQQIAKVEYPKVTGDSIFQTWYPYRDTMHLKTIKLPFRMFEEKALLAGDLYYSSNGLSGKGKVGFESVELASEKYKFNHHTIDADTLDFNLYTTGTKDLAVTAQKYRTHVDLETRVVEFKTNKKGSGVLFPYSSFACFMDNVDWDMDKHEMKLYNDLGEKYANIDSLSREQLLKLDLSGSDLVATNPKADSLRFFSVTARYDMVNYVIDAEDVKLIRVADAAIFPDSSYVKILKGGKIQKLQNAGIIADTTNRYHTIERADVDIFSRKNFQAKGYYQYAGTDKVLQEFLLPVIGVDTSGKTYARGDIPENNNFTLSPHFSYKGKVNMISDRRALSLEGYFQTKDDCFKDAKKYWVHFNSWVDPTDVRIPVEQPLIDINGKNLDLAIMISNYEQEIYTSWFAPRAVSFDTALVSGSGEVYYDEPASAYKVSQPPEEPGVKNRLGMSYFTGNCVVDYTGPIGLGLFYNYVDLQGFGDVKYLIVPDSTTFNLTITLDFPFYETALKMVTDSLVKADLKGLDITRKGYDDFIQYALGAEGSKDLRNEISSSGGMRRLPEKLGHTLVLTDVNLYWNSTTKSYMSQGPIGIISIGKDPVNRYAKGYLELIHRRSGDVISLYFEINPLKYYFFDYRNGTLQTISSDNLYNDRINALKPEKRMLTKPGLEEPYEFLVTNRSKMVEFLRRMQQFIK
jgi:hypothetical protein